MEDHRLSLIRAIALALLVMKALSKLAQHIHQNPSPDFDWMESQVLEMKAWIDEWCALRLESAERHDDLSDLAGAYFANAKLETYPPTLDRMVAKVRVKVAGGILPMYKNEGLHLLRYDSKLFNNEQSWALANALGVSLE
jgi:hypothetical protein